MGDSKITALTALTAADPINDMLPIVDVSDTTMAASGTTKKISVNNILSSSPTASGALTVTGLVTAGSATITGDLTVRTNKLAVTSTGVGIGMTPITPLSGVIGTTGAVFFRTTDPAAAVATPYIQAPASTGFSSTSPAYGFWYQACGIGNPALNNVSIITDSAERYKIDSTGVSTWYVGGSTAMTLNSTGLGIGASPAAKLHVTDTSVAAATALVRFVGQSSYNLDIQSVNNSVSTVGNRFNFNIGSGGGEFSFSNSGGTRMYLDQSGNVGIGVTPSVKLDVLSAAAEGTIRLTSTIDGSNASPKASSLSLRSGTSSVETARIASFNRFANVGGGDLVFSTADTSGVLQTRATIDSSGNLLVGTTGSLSSFADGRIEVLAIASSYCLVADATATSAAAIGIRGNDSTVAASFYNASTGGTVGSIVINSGGVSYNTTSDYRLKESVKPISGGLARVNALKPSIYNWKSNGSTGEGFIAHELAEVVPFAVSGEKDAMNADGTIKSQGIDMSRIVPILVAAIQELTARVQTLEAR